MSEQLSQIKELAAKRTVLFVEDDKKVVKSMQSALTPLFKQVFVCYDGKEGLASYENNNPDIILTDIQMPNMDGITMAKKIRDTDEEIPIIIMSAYSDEAHLMDSIYLGINRYIKKPIDGKKFFSALLHVLKKLENEEQARAYQSEKLARAINETADATLKEAMNIFPSPAFVFDDAKKLYFINVHGLELFSPENLEQIQQEQSIDPFIVKRQGTLESLFDVSGEGARQNKLILQTPTGRQRVYLVHYTVVNTHEKSLHVYALSDITRAEYEHQKSKNLSTYLHEVIRFYRKQRQECTPLSRPVQETQKPAQEEPKAKEQSYEEIRLSAMHYEAKTDAKTYMQEIDDGVKDEMDELEDIEKELTELLEEGAEQFNQENLDAISEKISSYARTIGLLMDFEDISFSLQKLVDLLQSLNAQEVDKRKLLLLLESIADDLRMWRQSIFVKQDTVDIHYLDASLLSSCLQIETDFGEQKDADPESDELELF